MSGYRLRIQGSRDGFMRMASLVEMPSHSSTAVSGGTRCPFLSPRRLIYGVNSSEEVTTV